MADDGEEKHMRRIMIGMAAVMIPSWIVTAALFLASFDAFIPVLDLRGALGAVSNWLKGLAFILMALGCITVEGVFRYQLNWPKFLAYPAVFVIFALCFAGWMRLFDANFALGQLGSAP